MLSAVARERPSSLGGRLLSTFSRFNATLRPAQTASFSTKSDSSPPIKTKKERKPHVWKPYKAPPGANPERRVKLFGTSLKLKWVDPVKVEGKRVKLEVEAIFDNEKKAQERVNEFIANKLSETDIPTIASLFRVAAQTLKKEESLLKPHLPALARRIDALSNEPWTFMHISFVIYGLQHSKEKDRHSLSILSSMVKVATEALKGETAPKALDISMILLGLQNNDITQKDAVAMLNIVNEMLQMATTTHFKAQMLSNAFYGLKGMSSNCPEALAVLASLSPRVIKCKEELSPQQISFALCGLSGMSCHHVEVTDALIALKPRVTNVPRTFRASHVGNAMLGMQKMEADNVIAMEMMNALLPEFKHCREGLTEDDIKKVLLGTKKMGNKCHEVRAVKTALGMRKYLDTDENRGVDDRLV